METQHIRERMRRLEADEKARLAREDKANWAIIAVAALTTAVLLLVVLAST